MITRRHNLVAEFPKINKILFATDLSQNSDFAYRYAVILANLTGAGITVLHVLADLPPNAELLLTAILGYVSRDELKQRSQAEIIASIKTYLQDFCAEIIHRIPSCPVMIDNIVVEAGTPVNAILHYIHQSKCDLVIMGSRGHGIIKEALIGSTSRKVLKKSPKPVLIVPLQ
jgi:nucleotide-binding universal stress UspA family protein